MKTKTITKIKNWLQKNKKSTVIGVISLLLIVSIILLTFYSGVLGDAVNITVKQSGSSQEITFKENYFNTIHLGETELDFSASVFFEGDEIIYYHPDYIISPAFQLEIALIDESAAGRVVQAITYSSYSAFRAAVISGDVFLYQQSGYYYDQIGVGITQSFESDRTYRLYAFYFNSDIMGSPESGSVIISTMTDDPSSLPSSPTYTYTPPSSGADEGFSLSKGAIIGLSIVGGVVVLVMITIIIIQVRKQRL